MKTSVSSATRASTAIAPVGPRLGNHPRLGNARVGQPEAISEALATRRRAGVLLDSLMSERVRLETKLAEVGRRDPIKVVTGHSAIEQAIASTKAMIASLDRLVRSGTQ